MEDDWVVDGLVGFLNSPMWKVLVDNFMEQNCIVFDQGEEIRNRAIYKEVHSEYQELVEDLLHRFTLDVGITAEQLADACIKSKNLRFEHKKLFQPLLASEDFEIFKSIMLQKNVDLECQALFLLQRQLGQYPDLYQSGTKPRDETTTSTRRVEDEEKILLEVLEQSKKEYDLMKALDKGEMEKLLALAMQESLRLSQVSGGDVEEMVDQVQKEGSEITTTEESKSSEPLAKSGGSSIQSLLPLADGGQAAATNKGISGEEAAQLWLHSARSEAEIRNSTLVKQKISLATKLPDDPKAREAYLKRQRNRLLESKKKVHAAELKSYRATLTFGRQPLQSLPVPSSSDKGKKDGDQTAVATPPSLKTRTGILCSVIGRKLKKEETDL